MYAHEYVWTERRAQSLRKVYARVFATHTHAHAHAHAHARTHTHTRTHTHLRMVSTHRVVHLSALFLEVDAREIPVRVR